ncbi:MAG: hexokinase A [Pycnora praestabilis]|nr:MAG: hexokinase A [Pycnora praestabilis]
MVGLGPKRKPSRKGSMSDVPKDLLEQIKDLERLFTVDAEKLKKITDHFVSELEKGLTVKGGSIPMNPTWVMSFPTGYETGTYLALDMGGTNLRVCEITLAEEKGEFDITQSKYRMPEELKTGKSEELWEYIADCLQQFIEYHHEDEELETLPLGFTFSYPATQDYIDHGVLQRWTKGFDIEGVEGHDVVPLFEEALAKRGVPIKLTALINDTTGTLIASAYTDDHMKIGCIFGTGCNAAYMENCGSVPKIADMKLDPDLPIAINCEWGAFDNEHKVLPRTQYDIIVDENSPRPGQQAFEKMIAGLYLGEIFRLVLVGLHENPNVDIFPGQNIAKLKKAYTLDSSFLSLIEEFVIPIPKDGTSIRSHLTLTFYRDPFENLTETHELFINRLDIKTTRPELELIRRLAELIGTRAARLSSCGVAAICKKKNIEACHVGADGSVFNKYPHFKARGAQALREILDWPKGKRDPIDIRAAEDGSGVGAALIAALTMKRIQEGNLAGIKNTEDFDQTTTQHWRDEGYDVSYLPWNGGGKQYREKLHHLSDDLDLGEKYALVAYGEAAGGALLVAQKPIGKLCVLVAYYPTILPSSSAASPFPPSLRVLVHLAGSQRVAPKYKSYSYADAEPGFAEHDDENFDKIAAGLAWSRSLDQVRRGFGIEVDLEGAWEGHLAQGERERLTQVVVMLVEFKTKDADATMRTMVPEPYVNHIPTMTGGIGASDLRRFYHDYFIPSNPPSMRMKLISRTIGSDRVVDEMHCSFRHTTEMPWMLPNVPPTNKLVEVALVSVVRIRGGKLCHEHIYWDQASVLVQIGLLDPELGAPGLGKNGVEELPIVGVESARKVLDEEGEESNLLIADW